MSDLFSHTHRAEGPAQVRLDPTVRADRTVPAGLFGKFVEHLYSPRRVTNALEAQTLFNPTFGSWKFQHRTFDADGGRGAVQDRGEIAERIEQYADGHDLPTADRLEAAYRDGAALWWFPVGDAEAVRTSPDVGTADDRAQRVEVAGSAAEPSGLAQWCYLPLHRTRRYEGRLTLRADSETTVRLAIHGPTDPDGELGDVIASTTVTAGETYRTVEFELAVPADRPGTDDDLFGFSVAVDPETTAATERGETHGSEADFRAGANVVFDRVLLYPDDHVGTADPDVVDLFSAADLPVLRWPGGNFVSGYDWRDGVGPVETRPTRPNPAWDAVEPNLFGTDEFLAFCEAVGCEPMICVNAGDGTAAEAADWVEYCNGDPEETELGALRAEHGHPEPYDVTYWELGNEVYGEWQTTWTTPGGYADRFERFREAMEAVDSDVEVFACGNRLTDWNEPVLDRADDLPWLTDHVLLECHADARTDPVELYNAHTGIAAQLGREYRDVAAACAEAGHPETAVAITELQLFTRFDEGAAAETDDPETDGAKTDENETDEPRLMESSDLPRNSSITEAVFDATVVTRCIRDGVVDLVTHSGVGNHGAGVRKERQRVWAEPCHYGHRLGRSLVGGTPVGVDVACGTFSTETTFGSDTSEWFGELRPVTDEPAVDAVAVEDADAHDVAVLLVHRDAGRGDITVDLAGGGLFDGFDEATVTTLTGEEMTAENTYEDPDRITPTETRRAVDDEGNLTVDLPQYSVVCVTVGGD